MKTAILIASLAAMGSVAAAQGSKYYDKYDYSYDDVKAYGGEETKEGNPKHHNFVNMFNDLLCTASEYYPSYKKEEKHETEYYPTYSKKQGIEVLRLSRN
jgi:hypothetical protein